MAPTASGSRAACVCSNPGQRVVGKWHYPANRPGTYPADRDRWRQSRAIKSNETHNAHNTAGHPDALSAWTRGDLWHRGRPLAVHGGESAARHDDRAGQGHRDTCVTEAALLGNTITLRARRLGHPGYPVMECPDIHPTLRYHSAMWGRRKKKRKEIFFWSVLWNAFAHTSKRNYSSALRP